MPKRIICLLLCIMLALTTLCSCGSKSNLLYLPIENTPTSLDPTISGITETDSIINNCYEGLIRMDASGKFLPGVAESWDISEDGLTYTFHLRSDSKWHYSEKMVKHWDPILGTLETRVTAHDFVFALQRALDPANGSPYASSLLAIENAIEVAYNGADKSTLGVVAEGDYTLTIHLAYPDENLLTTLASSAAMPCHQNFFEACTGKYGMEPLYTLCNGPYYYSTLSSNSGYVELTKNPEYRGKCVALADGIRFRLAKDLGTYDPGKKNVVTDAGGAIDAFSALVSEDENLDASILPKKYQRYVPETYKVLSYQNSAKCILFNFANPFLANEKIRKAFVYSTDLKALCGDNKMATGLVPDDIQLTAGTSYRKAVGPQKMPKQDLALSAKYLEKGLEEYTKANLEKDEVLTQYDIHVICLTSDEITLKKGFQNWQQVFGVKLNLRVDTYDTQAELDKAIAASKYDIVFTTLSGDTLATNFMNRFYSTSTKNAYGIEDPEFDKMQLKAIQAVDEATLKKQLKENEAYLLSKAYVLPVCFETNLLICDPAASSVSVQLAGAVFAAYTIA